MCADTEHLSMTKLQATGRDRTLDLGIDATKLTITPQYARKEQTNQNLCWIFVTFWSRLFRIFHFSKIFKNFFFSEKCFSSSSILESDSIPETKVNEASNELLMQPE